MFSYHMQWVEFGIYYLTTKEADRYIYNHSFSARGHSEAEFLVIMQQSAGLFWSRVMAHSAAECWLILQQSAGSFGLSSCSRNKKNIITKICTYVTNQNRKYAHGEI